MSRQILLGAGGHAKEALNILLQTYSESEVSLFDNTPNATDSLFGIFPIYHQVEHLRVSDTLYLGTGGIKVRILLSNLIKDVGAEWRGLCSKNTTIGTYGVVLNNVDIMDDVQISNDVRIGEGTLLNRNSNIHHDVNIGTYCEIAPSVQLLGNVTLGNQVFVGAGAIIFPEVTVGDGAIIGAGSVVTKDVLPNTKVLGNPAKSI